MATVSFYLDKRRITKKGYPLKLNIWHNRQFLVNTKFTAMPEKWNGSEFNRNEENWKAKNVAIRSMINKVEKLLLDLEEEGVLKSVTDRKLKEMIEGLIGRNTSKAEKKFINYLDEFVALKKNEGTKGVYLTTRNKIVDFDAGCTFETMDKKWLSSFEAWMASTMKVNAYAIHLRNIRAVFNYAIDEEYTTLYPFRKFKIRKEETRKRSLTVEQLRMLRDYDCEEYQRKYRDMFMLMFYLIGINAADLFLAKKGDVVNGRLEYKRAKTSKLYSVKIEPEAERIIGMYSGNGKYLLDVMDDYANYKDFLHRMGVALKQIGVTERSGRGGRKTRNPLFPELSSYWSRHTWATIAASLDIPKETISEALGHSIGSEVTSIYIKFDQRKVDDANRKVIDYVGSI